MREVRREKQLCRVLVDLSLICLWRALTMLGTCECRRESGLCVGCVCVVCVGVCGVCAKKTFGIKHKQ